MTGYVCPGCRANGMADECWHDERTWTLAEALRDAISALHADQAPWGTPEAMAWAFIDDADALNGRVGEPPYAAVAFHPDSPDNPRTGEYAPYTTIGLVNGRYLFAMPNEEGDVAAEFIGDVAGHLTHTPKETR